MKGLYDISSPMVDGIVGNPPFLISCKQLPALWVTKFYTVTNLLHFVTVSFCFIL